MQLDMKLPWVAVVPVPVSGRSLTEDNSCTGDGHEILLQGFHWDSHTGGFDQAVQKRKSWYQIISDHAEAVKAAGFNWVWFPPPSDSLDPHGYLPRRWHTLDSAFGSEAELRTAVQALKPLRVLADVVVNHRVGAATAGADFEDPPFRDNRRAVTRDDESGIGLGNPDTGEQFLGGRDLDHTNPEVRTAVKEYMRRLRTVGFQGWRYDFAKGYHGRFVGEYNEATGPAFSVGEFYDGDRQKVTDWIDATGGRCNAFDFPTRFLLFEACWSDDFSRLRSLNCGRVVPGGLVGYWPSRAVTFLENHDTEYRRSEHEKGSHETVAFFTGKMLGMGYAYLFTHPGMPCVFWSHYFEWGSLIQQQIGTLIRIRKGLGLHARSNVDIKEARRGLYAAVIDGKVAVKLGSRDWSPGGGWQLALDGDRFAVWGR